MVRQYLILLLFQIVYIYLHGCQQTSPCCNRPRVRPELYRLLRPCIHGTQGPFIYWRYPSSGGGVGYPQRREKPPPGAV